MKGLIHHKTTTFLPGVLPHHQRPFSHRPRPTTLPFRYPQAAQSGDAASPMADEVQEKASKLQTGTGGGSGEWGQPSTSEVDWSGDKDSPKSRADAERQGAVMIFN